MTQTAIKRLDDFLEAPSGHRVGVFGLGVVGQAVVRHLLGQGVTVVAADRRTDIQDDLWHQEGIEIRLGEMDGATFSDVDALVISPGVDPRQPAVEMLHRRDIPVLGELELVGPIQQPVIAITGTNGKSTTTSLTGALVAASGRQTFVGGNLGDPIIAWRGGSEPTEVLVLELSSFQIETAYHFRPDVAVVLNIAADHTDRYDTMDEYAATKERLVAGLKATGTAILNYTDDRVRAMASAAGKNVWWFSTDRNRIPAQGVFLDGDTMVGCGDLSILGEVSLAHPRLQGVHNRENAMAAILAAHALDPIDLPQMQQAYAAFSGLPHRLEWVGEIEGVQFINDSKATNDASAGVAIEAIQRPTVLLLGGCDKGAGYDAVRLALSLGHVRRVIAFGAAQNAIAAALNGVVALDVAPHLSDAFAKATAIATSGDTVLLAPACSSFDEFQNYAQRGDAFKGWVHRYQAERAQQARVAR